MKLQLDCIPCFQRQALKATRLVSEDPILQEKVLRRVIENLIWLKWTDSPPQIAHVVHGIVKEECGYKDPYVDIKRECNDTIMQRYDEFKTRVEEAKDPFYTALQLAIAGNIMDYGPDLDIELDGTISRVAAKGLQIDDRDKLIEALEKAANIFYVADNAGEIVFDKLFLELIREKFNIEKIRFCIKGAPIINDATMTDVVQIGLDKMDGIEFIKMDVGDPKSGISRDSKEFDDLISSSDVVISKGQGNYEALSEKKGLFFLLMAKCPIVARDLNVEMGSFILKAV